MHSKTTYRTVMRNIRTKKAGEAIAAWGIIKQSMERIVCVRRISGYKKPKKTKAFFCDKKVTALPLGCTMGIGPNEEAGIRGKGGGGK